jgi:hypothetical protein
MNSHKKSSRSTTSTPSGLTAPTRTGKIARLPAAVRDQLNARLHDGESAVTLLPWLNALPEVQAALTAHAAGQQNAARPVTPQNLSEWRRGGFADWLCAQEARAWLTHLREESTALSQDSGDHTPVSALLAAPLAVALGRCLQAAVQQNVSQPLTKPAHLNRLLDLASALNRLRRCDHAESRLRLEHQRSQSELALADHRLLVEREHWKTEQAQAEITAREKVESDKIEAEENKIRRARVAGWRAKFYGANNPYAALDAAALAAAAPSAQTPAESPKTASSPSLADKDAALERLNALLARCAPPSSSALAPANPHGAETAQTSSATAPESHPVAPNPTESNQKNPPTTTFTAPQPSTPVNEAALDFPPIPCSNDPHK